MTARPRASTADQMLIARRASGRVSSRRTGVAGVAYGKVAVSQCRSHWPPRSPSRGRLGAASVSLSVDAEIGLADLVVARQLGRRPRADQRADLEDVRAGGDARAPCGRSARPAGSSCPRRRWPSRSGRSAGPSAARGRATARRAAAAGAGPAAPARSRASAARRPTACRRSGARRSRIRGNSSSARAQVLRRCRPGRRAGTRRAGGSRRR